jgi:3D (Asp-Asp-Asp) domain-containing protein
MRIDRAALPGLLFLVALGLAGCAASSGQKWVNELPDEGPPSAAGDWKSADSAADARPSLEDRIQIPDRAIVGDDLDDTPDRPRDPGDGPPRDVRAGSAQSELYRNTYYDFPSEGAGDKSSTIYDAACVPITKVTTDFHDRLCVQGSGRLDSGATVSFAKRDCGCASICPRTGQKLCYERLDQKRFPSGRGATGQAITPLYTVAVDSTVIPLGTRIFVPELVGLPRLDGSKHDGCFLAEDRGLKVVGRQIDFFTGDPANTARWNAIVPSNRGVHVVPNDPRCRAGG